jgi:hypothetical protein
MIFIYLNIKKLLVILLSYIMNKNNEHEYLLMEIKKK